MTLEVYYHHAFLIQHVDTQHAPQTGINFLLSPSAKQRRNLYSGLQHTYHDGPVKKAIVNLPIRLKGNSKRISGNSLSPLGAEIEDIGAVSHTFQTGVTLRLQRRLVDTHF